MNILVPVSWLRDFIKTKAPTKEIARSLSLCSQSVERTYRQKGEDILEIEITSNRPDCLSPQGLARELHAILPRFNFPARLTLPSEPNIDFSSLPPCPLKVEINPPEICPRFTAILIDQVTIKPSPPLIQKRLFQIGLRPINNVVDISNYLMFETGQPIHTFDYDKIKKEKMIMRLSKRGEKVITLDGVERPLPGGDIVIEDGQGRLIDLCGIMGAQNSAIDAHTKRVLFFVQAYAPHLIRRTSMLLGHRTEAAVRFERGIDLYQIPTVVKQGAQMMEKLSGGKIASQMIDIFPSPPSLPNISLSFARAQKIIGEKIPPLVMVNILRRLGFKLVKKNSREAQFKIPTWRLHDISLEEDLIEEIARIYGYFNLQGQIPPLPPHWGMKPLKKTPKGKFPPVFYWRERIKDYLRYQGFDEVYGYSFISQAIIEKAGLNPQNHLRLKNPISQELAYMRRDLLPSLLNTISKNQTYYPKINIYELANTYLPQKGDLPQEQLKLTVATNNLSLLRLKGILEGLLSELGLKNVIFKPEKNTPAAQIYSQKKLIGNIKAVAPAILKNFSLNEEINTFTLDVDLLSLLANKKKTFSPPSPYPPIIEDLTFIVPPKTYLGPLIQAIEEVSPLIKKVLFVTSFNNSKTLRLFYENRRQPLTDKQVAQIRKKVIEKIETKFHARLKGKSSSFKEKAPTKE